MDPLLERAEVLASIVGVDHDLAVEHETALWERDLREIARQRLSAARLDHALASVDERDRAEAVVLRLICPLLTDRKLDLGARQLRLDRGPERECHGSRDARGSG